MAIPETTKAVIVRGKADLVIKTVPTPKLRDDYVLVKTSAVALNPTDWKNAEYIMGDPTNTRVGCDYAGVVVAVGSAVKQPFKVGDRIAGGAHGSNKVQHEDGAFAEYIVVKPDLAFKIPDSMSDEDAATYGLGATTVGQSFYQQLKLNPPSKPLATPEAILIYGGASASGLLGIQFAKLGGYRVLTTASASHTEYLKSLGADEVFDYHDTDAALAGIKAALNGSPLRYAWDCISSDDTAAFCAKALAFTPASAADTLHYSALLPVNFESLKTIDPRIDGGFTFYYTAFGEDFDKWGATPANPAHLEFARAFWVETRELIASGKLKPARAFVNRGGSGLEGVLVGLQELKQGKVRAGKLVYTIGK